MYRQSQLTQLLSGRRILIAGYGREGKSTHALLNKILDGERVDIACNDEEIFAHLDQARLQNEPYDLIIKSPGISTMKFEGRCELNTITSQTDLFLQVYHDITVGVTGTKGKSTTTTLIHHVLKHSIPGCNVVLAGNMGIPLFDILDQLNDHSRVVAEFSCHQLENIHCSPHVSVILNLYQEHLDHYHSYHDYQMAKMQIALHQDAHDACFLGGDSQDLMDLLRSEELCLPSRSAIFTYQDALNDGIDKLSTTLTGRHNITNIYVAKLVAEFLSVSSDQFTEALASFRGLPHRLQQVGTYHGITFYNDSISTIPEACIAAMEALPQVDTVILGGFDRGIDYSPLGNYLVDHPHLPRNIVFVGKAGARMHEEWSARNDNPLADRNVLLESDYEVIVQWCYQHTAPGSVCLLSPAAASYDAFKNFEHRGQVFEELILKYNK